MRTEIYVRTIETCSLCKGTGRFYNQTWLVFEEALKAWQQQNPRATQEQISQYASDYWEAQGFKREPDSRYVDGPWDYVSCPDPTCTGSRQKVTEHWVDAEEFVKKIIAQQAQRLA